MIEQWRRNSMEFNIPSSPRTPFEFSSKKRKWDVTNCENVFLGKIHINNYCEKETMEQLISELESSQHIKFKHLNAALKLLGCRKSYNMSQDAVVSVDFYTKYLKNLLQKHKKSEFNKSKLTLDKPEFFTPNANFQWISKFQEKLNQLCAETRATSIIKKTKIYDDTLSNNGTPADETFQSNWSEILKMLLLENYFESDLQSVLNLRLVCKSFYNEIHRKSNVHCYPSWVKSRPRLTMSNGIATIPCILLDENSIFLKRDLLSDYTSNFKLLHGLLFFLGFIDEECLKLKKTLADMLKKFENAKKKTAPLKSSIINLYFEVALKCCVHFPHQLKLHVEYADLFDETNIRKKGIKNIDILKPELKLMKEVHILGAAQKHGAIREIKEFLNNSKVIITHSIDTFALG